MTLGELQSYLAKSPFQAFRIVLASGGAYEIRQPEECIVSKGNALIHQPAHGQVQPSGVPTYLILKPTEIIRVELL
jgi:hypothetical protein